MDLNKKLEEVSRLFRIEGTYLGYETIQVGNVNKTYEVKFLLPDGTPKSFLIQNVNTYAFRAPVQLMENIDKVTEHIRAKKPGQTALHFHHTADRKTYVADGTNFWRMTNFIRSVTHNTVTNEKIIRNCPILTFISSTKPSPISTTPASATSSWRMRWKPIPWAG